MKLIFIIMIFLVAGCTGNDKKASTENPVATTHIDGEILFKNNCLNCHKPDRDSGPDLKGSLERWGDKKSMYEFIRNPSKSISDNPYARSVFEKWNKTMMTASPHLSDAEIDAIMNYCETRLY